MLSDTFLDDATGERQKCLNRMIKHFKSKRIITEKTLDELVTLTDLRKRS